MKTRLIDSIKRYRDDMEKFLRDLIRIPGASRNEGAVVKRIEQEMQKIGFDQITIDGMGNILGKIGNGRRIIAMDAHIDTVEPGNLHEWKWDPYEGAMDKDNIYGLGAVDQKAGMASLLYGVKGIREHGLPDDCSLFIVGSVQEEDCDGLCWKYIIEEDRLRPECVVITEPTNLQIYRGHRGRMEITITTRGKAAHASAPERGINPVYSMARIISRLEKLNEHLGDDPFLGRGTIAVTNITCTTPSLCSVPDSCSIHLDRRLARGEDKARALKEVNDLIEEVQGRVETRIPVYELPGYRGLLYTAERYFPTWVLPEEHPLLEAALATFREAFDTSPIPGRWTFSTNGVATMGMYGIPTIGFGPGNELTAHSADEYVPREHLLKAASWYAMFPAHYQKAMEEYERDERH